MEYFYPNLDTIDDCWHEALLFHIPMMLAGTDIDSYVLTMASMTSRIHDGHLVFGSMDRGMMDNSVLQTSLNHEFGRFGVHEGLLIEAEGQVVVQDNSVAPLMQGDIILRVNGVDIDDVFAEIIRYISLPGEGQSLAMLVAANSLIRSHTQRFEFDMLRDDKELQLSFLGGSGVSRRTLAPSLSMTGILPGNIGYINPQIYRPINIMMQEFADTNGLIINLRARPRQLYDIFLAEYLLDERLPFITYSLPFQPIPGAFIDNKGPFIF